MKFPYTKQEVLVFVLIALALMATGAAHRIGHALGYIHW